mgnify:CR=1 FL=1
MWVALLMTAVLAGCDSSTPELLQTYAHPNGLRLSVSESCKVRITTAGFVIEPMDARQQRNPFVVSVALLAERPKDNLYRVHYVGSGRILWYSATYPEPTGMGGPEWEIIAVERVGKHWIEYRERKQDEWQPRELWKIARELSYAPPAST